MITDIKEIRSIEDFIDFKYKSELLYKSWNSKEHKEIPKIKIPISELLTDVHLLDVEVNEEIDEQLNVSTFNMKAIIQLPEPMHFIGKDNEDIHTDVIALKNTCISPEGCLSVDWEYVSCKWEISV
jgi:hypothetical protein